MLLSWITERKMNWSKFLIGTTIAIIDAFTKLRKLAEIGDLRKLSREELEFYDEDFKNMRDIYFPLASHLAKKRSLTK